MLPFLYLLHTGQLLLYMLKLRKIGELLGLSSYKKMWDACISQKQQSSFFSKIIINIIFALKTKENSSLRLLNTKLYIIIPNKQTFQKNNFFIRQQHNLRFALLGFLSTFENDVSMLGILVKYLISSSRVTQKQLHKFIPLKDGDKQMQKSIIHSIFCYVVLQNVAPQRSTVSMSHSEFKAVIYRRRKKHISGNCKL